MAERKLRTALKRLIAGPAAADTSDSELLERFADQADEAAFGVLVARHGPMVLGVCRRVLGQVHDAEDAFQATFLVLARNTGRIRRRESVGSWLHGVAHRLALKARVALAQRRLHERQAATMRLAESSSEVAGHVLGSALDEELQRLPETFRAPLVLCYLEGRTQPEAARELGWPAGSMSWRLGEARDRLRERLAQRGLAVAAGGLAAGLADGVQAAVPASLVEATAKAATAFVAGNAAGVVSEQSILWAKGALQTMYWNRVKIATALLLLFGCAVAGSLFGYRALAGKPGPDQALADKPAADPAPKAKTDPAGVPLEARLVAKKDTYRLDLGGKTPDEFRKLLQDKTYPPAPTVELELQFRNTGDKDLSFLVGGTNPDMPLLLKLDGAGAFNAVLPAMLAAIVSRPPTEISLASGKTHSFAVGSLRTANLGREGSISYWTEPGEYTLTATFRTEVNPAPQGAKEGRKKGFGQVTLTSNPLKLKVEAPK
jgi:RNA polymerase sigma factor (sigma-70 family)